MGPVAGREDDLGWRRSRDPCDHPRARRCGKRGPRRTNAPSHRDRPHGPQRAPPRRSAPSRSARHHGPPSCRPKSNRMNCVDTSGEANTTEPLRRPPSPLTCRPKSNRMNCVDTSGEANTTDRLGRPPPAVLMVSLQNEIRNWLDTSGEANTTDRLGDRAGLGQTPRGRLRGRVGVEADGDAGEVRANRGEPFQHERIVPGNDQLGPIRQRSNHVEARQHRADVEGHRERPGGSMFS